MDNFDRDRESDGSADLGQPHLNMDGDSTRPDPIRFTLVVELSLGLAGIVAGFFTGHWPIRPAFPTSVDLGFGTIAALPMIGFFFLTTLLPWKAFREIERAIDSGLPSLVGDFACWRLLLVAIAAGLGEELLFRGFLQQLLTTYIGTHLGVLMASLAFGLCHYLSNIYLLVAFAMGCYFGWLFKASASIWVPVTAHAVYDFIGLLWYANRIKKKALSRRHVGFEVGESPNDHDD